MTDYQGEQRQEQISSLHALGAADLLAHLYHNKIHYCNRQTINQEGFVVAVAKSMLQTL